MDIQKQISDLIKEDFKQKPLKIEKMTTGICNEVYLIALDNNKEIILRFNTDKKHMIGSGFNIPLFKKQNINVPEIITEDYSKTKFPYSYQILSKIKGKDIGSVFHELNEEQLKDIAKKLASVINKLKKLPTSGKFGDIAGKDEENMFDSWLGVILDMYQEIKTRNQKTGVLDSEVLNILDNVVKKYTPYLKSAESIFYYDDMCSKNIMIDNGKFSGIVDLDYVRYGDYLEAIGRIKASYFGMKKGEIYLEAIIKELGLSAKDKELITVYAILNLIYWITEEGIQFNLNTTTKINWENVKRKTEAVKEMYKEIQ
ncbi:phosphotransferase [Patescibacteria group bacterium]